MSGMEGPHAASTGSVTITEPRVQAVPAVQNIGILAVLKSVQNFDPGNTASTRGMYILAYAPEILPGSFNAPVAPPPECNLLLLPLCGHL